MDKLNVEKPILNTHNKAESGLKKYNWSYEQET